MIKSVAMNCELLTVGVLDMWYSMYNISSKFQSLHILCKSSVNPVTLIFISCLPDLNKYSVKSQVFDLQ